MSQHVLLKSLTAHASQKRPSSREEEEEKKTFLAAWLNLSTRLFADRNCGISSRDSLAGKRLSRDFLAGKGLSFASYNYA